MRSAVFLASWFIACPPNCRFRATTSRPQRSGKRPPRMPRLVPVAPLSSPEETPMPASYETHRAQIRAVLLAWDMPEENANATADILSWADLHGVDSHGISMLPG